nr:ribonuclease H-like domain-containing protein [Tanacetum cinerariifolium]
MDLESAQNNVVAKLPLFKQGDYKMWKLIIEQYFQVQDYASWDVIENGNSFKPVPRTTANIDDLDIMSIDDLYNNFKIVEQEVKRIVISSSSLESPNMAFLSFLGSTNKVDISSIQVSVVNTPVSTVSSPDNTANLSDATVYAFLENQFSTL